MITDEDFLAIVRELALPLSGDESDNSLDRPVHWDSLHVLRLVAAIERRTGRRVPVGRLLRDRNLRSIYDCVVAA